MKKYFYILPIMFLIFFSNTNVFGISSIFKSYEILDSFPLEVPANNSLTQEEYNNFLKALENFSSVLYLNYNDGTIQVITFNQKVNFEYVEWQDTVYTDNMNFSYNVIDPPPTLVVMNHVISPWGYYNPPTQMVVVEGQNTVVGSSYSISNPIVSGKIFSNSNIYYNTNIINDFSKKLSISGTYNFDFTNYEFIINLSNSLPTDRIEYSIDNVDWLPYVNDQAISINDNIIIRARAYDKDNKFIDYLEVKITSIFKSDNSSNNYKINYYMRNFKAYFTPVVLGGFPYEVGVKVQVIDGVDNIVEKEYTTEQFKDSNKEFFITGKRNTNFTVAFTFYNKNSNTVLYQTTMTVYVKDGTGNVVSGDGSSSFDNSNLDPNNPFDSIIYIKNQATSFFEIISIFFSSLPSWVTVPISFLFSGLIILVLIKLAL